MQACSQLGLAITPACLPLGAAASHTLPALPHPPTPTRPPKQVLKFVVGATHIGVLALGLMGVLPFACWTSAMVAYGMAGEMVKLAETNLSSEWWLAAVDMTWNGVGCGGSR